MFDDYLWPRTEEILDVETGYPEGLGALAGNQPGLSLNKTFKHKYLFSILSDLRYGFLN